MAVLILRVTGKQNSKILNNKTNHSLRIRYNQTSAINQVI